MPSPDLTFRKSTSPYDALGSILYSESKAGSDNIPVLQGEESNAILFRIYNNFALNLGISSALNVRVTTYDGIGVGSHTAFTAPVSQSWIHLMEHGFGGNSVLSPDLFTRYDGVDTPVGGNNVYIPEKGSDGLYTIAQIKAGNNTNGAGYIEFKTYASVPNPTVGDTYSFVISCLYEYSS